MGILDWLLGRKEQATADDYQKADRPPVRPPPRSEQGIEDRRTSPPPGSLALLAGGGGVDVVGESFYRPAIQAAVGGRHRDGVKMYLTATIHAEPTNKYDPNAIVVELGGKTVGHLSASDATRYRAPFATLAAQGLVGSCTAQIRGGWEDADGRHDYGVTVYIDTPARLTEQLARTATR